MDKGIYLGHFHCKSLISIASKQLVNMLLGQGYKQTLSSEEPCVRVTICVITVLYMSSATLNTFQNTIQCQVMSYIDVYSIVSFGTYAINGKGKD